MKRSVAFLVFVGASWASVVSAATLQVGPGQTYTTPCQAVAAAANGDVIEIAAGTYSGDVCNVNKSNLTLRGMGGLAKLDAAGKNSGGKAIWVISGNDTIVENIEFTGATVQDQNGAGIRQEGANLTIRGCYFHDNENGILAGDNANSTITIERTEFANNGFGDGQTHNLYINHVAKLVFQYNYSHSAKVGHLLKSRALETWVLYNRLTQEGGDGSYEIDVPNAGRTIIIGNLIQQGPNTQNGSIVSYGREGPSNPSNELFVVNNSFVNERPNGGTFLNIDGGVTIPVIVRNNIFVGPGTVINQANAVQGSNFQGDPKFVNQAAFDYHLQAMSPCADTGEAPGMGAGIDLTPKFHYVHPASSTGRSTVDNIDVGAYELGGDGGAGGSGSGGAAGAGGAGSGAAGGAGGAGSGSSSSGSSSGEGGTGGVGGAAGSGGAGAGEDGSCSCHVVGDATVPARASFAALLAFAFAARRSRRRERA
jgi:MYXO-CTERM domain-containing protein